MEKRIFSEGIDWVRINHWQDIKHLAREARWRLGFEQTRRRDSSLKGEGADSLTEDK